MLKSLLLRLKKGTEHLNYGRHIVRAWCREHFSAGRAEVLQVIDIGMGDGGDLAAAKEEAGEGRVVLHGVEVDAARVKRGRAKGVRVYTLDIERGRLPVKDGAFDVVIANQILEHTKEVFWVISEMARALRQGGIAIVGLPNLASLHNRIALLFGQQPTSIRSLSPHVRGFTRPDFTALATRGGYFELLKVRGSNFYPLPPWLSGAFSRLLPNMAVSLFFLLRRTGRKGRYVDLLKGMDLETPFFRGGR